MAETSIGYRFAGLRLRSDFRWGISWFAEVTTEPARSRSPRLESQLEFAHLFRGGPQVQRALGKAVARWFSRSNVNRESLACDGVAGDGASGRAATAQSLALGCLLLAVQTVRRALLDCGRGLLGPRGVCRFSLARAIRLLLTT